MSLVLLLLLLLLLQFTNLEEGDRDTAVAEEGTVEAEVAMVDRHTVVVVVAVADRQEIYYQLLLYYRMVVEAPTS